jgi:hypothetical protein
MEDAGTVYEKGLSYLTVARKILLVARRLDEDDREQVRHLADGLVSKATDLLTSVVKPQRRRRQPANDGDQGSSPD